MLLVEPEVNDIHGDHLVLPVQPEPVPVQPLHVIVFHVVDRLKALGAGLRSSIELLFIAGVASLWAQLHDQQLILAFTLGVNIYLPSDELQAGLV